MRCQPAVKYTIEFFYGILIASRQANIKRKNLYLHEDNFTILIFFVILYKKVKFWRKYKWTKPN